MPQSLLRNGCCIAPDGSGPGKRDGKTNSLIWMHPNTWVSNGSPNRSKKSIVVEHEFNHYQTQNVAKMSSRAEDGEVAVIRIEEDAERNGRGGEKGDTCLCIPKRKWLTLVTIAALYNVVFIVGRAFFWELDEKWPILWTLLDAFSDFIYLTDMLVHAHEGYLEEGLMVKDPRKLRRNYFHSPHFKLDLVSILPTELVCLGIASATPASSDPTPWPPPVPRPVIARLNRLARLPRANDFFSKTETRTPHPNAFRIAKVLGSTLLLIHWNACAYFALSCFLGFGSDGWVYAQAVRLTTTLSHQYIYSFYWSTLTLTTIGETPPPETELEHVFVALDFLAGVLIFATIVGNVGTMVSGAGAARMAFRAKCDSVKRYLTLRKVSKDLEDRVIRWFDYVWASRQALMDEEEGRVLSTLPPHLRSEIALHVHLDTLRQVRIFQDAEPGLLAELVLKLRLQVFSPGDYVCRKGDVGRELYIVKRGKLNVSEEEEEIVQVTLGAGSVFGEVALLDIPGTKTGNRRTASVRSVGYSDLFCLSKVDLWSALEEYPAARRRLSERGRRILAKDGLLADKKKENEEKKESPNNDQTPAVPASEEGNAVSGITPSPNGEPLQPGLKKEETGQTVVKHVRIGQTNFAPSIEDQESTSQAMKMKGDEAPVSPSQTNGNVSQKDTEKIENESDLNEKNKSITSAQEAGKSANSTEEMESSDEIADSNQRQSDCPSDDDEDSQSYRTKEKNLEDRVKHIEELLENLQLRFARLMAEFCSNQAKVKQRLAVIEQSSQKIRSSSTKTISHMDNDDRMNNTMYYLSPAAIMNETHYPRQSRQSSV
ncbi:cyclic nucleotide-gated cation channel subunit A [Hetaerina americana]|uniref:cyclic nucleotide-gated cation channel subunit A n=1 Tax=Hetaerina americana TaxID=62018 RepID=UPI003A7F1E84